MPPSNSKDPGLQHKSQYTTTQHNTVPQKTAQQNLELSKVTKRYGLGSPVISDFNHTFMAGTSTGLTGPNGSGKTTLLRMLSVTSFPTSGRIEFAGRSVHEAPYEYLKNVGIVHDESSLPQYLSAVELLEYTLRSRKKWQEDSPKHIAHLLDTLMLDERRETLIGTYSSGMLKKTQIGMALIASPSLLLMDEPFRGLDVDSLDAAISLFSALKEKGSLMIIASHRKEMLTTLCDDYIHLEPHKTS